MSIFESIFDPAYEAELDEGGVEGTAGVYNQSVLSAPQPSMSPDSFCYWLQGWLEMTEEITVLTRTQFTTIGEHLELALASLSPQGYNDQRAVYFCYWLRGVWDVVDFEQITGADMAVICSKLSEVFIKVTNTPPHMEDYQGCGVYVDPASYQGPAGPRYCGAPGSEQLANQQKFC